MTESIIFIIVGILAVISYTLWLRSAMNNAQKCDCEGECKTIDLCEKFIPKRVNG